MSDENRKAPTLRTPGPVTKMEQQGRIPKNFRTVYYA